MKCPFVLESHQIQGGSNTADYANIFPIIQWLVKKVIETREETGDLMRLFAESQFYKNHNLPSEEEQKEHKEEAIEFVMAIGDRYKPTRKFKKSGRRVSYLNRKTQNETIQSALLEYGDFNVMTNTSNTTNSKERSEFVNQLEKTMGGGKNTGNKTNEEEEEEKRKRNELKKEMKQYVQQNNVNNQILGDLLPTNIQELEDQYQYTEEEETGENNNQQRFGMRMHEQQVNKIEHEITQQKNKLQNNKNKYEEYQEQYKEIQSIYNQKYSYNERIKQEIQKLDALETPENASTLLLLKSLVALNENLRNQETKFKSNCKRQLTSLKEQIDKIKKEINENIEGGGETQLINDTFIQSKEKLKKIRQLISKRTRDISLIERKIDEVPSRSELGQYQRQFVELYEQVASKFTETRQYYNTYNTLEDTKTYLAKEVSIINSIYDNYKTVMTSKTSREQFLESLNNILKSVIQSLEKVDQKLNSEKENKINLNERYTSLVEKERLYFKITKEFLEVKKIIL